ncbi:MAG: Uma2 family endonuclease [Cyanothece sp. SIO1E1]|nr:Uma2 family endonuclease [Cyanothece sp. SIO1E1]
MVQTPTQPIIYPEADGQPMADNTIQFRWITTIEGNLKAIFANDPNVFIAGDLFWYPVEGKPTIKMAPDVMVALGRPQSDRRSYKQWQENNIAPQVVFEIRSTCNTTKEMAKKLEFYDNHKVEEYYLYDPDDEELVGWLRKGERLAVIDEMHDFTSPRLKIRFETEPGPLKIYRPDGSIFETRQELENRANKAEDRASKLAKKLKELGIDPASVE